MAEYTKDWKVVESKGKYGICSTGRHIAIMVPRQDDKADAQRIVDCVNGCKDIENPLAASKLLEACKGLLKVALIAMPDTYFKSDTRVREANKAIAEAKEVKK